MATFVVTNATGPNTIAPGTIDLADYGPGDTFIIAGDVDENITFQDSGSSGTDFNIQFNSNLAENIKVEVEDGLQPTVEVGDNVDLGNDFEFDAKGAGDTTVTVGDNVVMGKKFEGPDNGSTTFTAGDNFSLEEMRLGDQNDDIVIGDGGVFDKGKFELGRGDDSLAIGNTDSDYDVKGGDGNDDIVLGEAGKLKVGGGRGDDNITVTMDSDSDYDLKGGADNDTLSILGLTNAQAEDVIADILDETSGETYDDNGTPTDFLDDVITGSNIKGKSITISGGGTIKKISKFEEVNFVCFAAGTLIKTFVGEKPIEALSCGDLVLTVDNSYQPIRWIGGCAVSQSELSKNPKLRPIRIRAGALGLDIPETDLLVSRQHRVLVRSKIARRMFQTDEVLVPAITLLALDGIDVADDVEDVSYWHMLFEQHEVIWSNGAPTESLFTGPEALKSVSPEARAEILTLFPELDDPDFQPPAARLVPARGKLAVRLAARHRKNARPLVVLE